MLTRPLAFLEGEKMARKKKKEKWLYIYPNPKLDLDVLDPQLPRQALNIVKLLRERGSIYRPQFLSELENVIRTRHKNGVRRILTYHNKMLVDRGIMEVRKEPD